MTALLRRLAILALVAALPAVRAADWPQWMGPSRDGVWNETDVLTRFPAGGPQKLWSVPVHLGYAGPAVVQGRVYLLDYVKTSGDTTPNPARRNVLTGTERVLCLDAATGEQVWVHTYDCPYNVSYPFGPRCTPTVCSGKVYTLGTMGHFFCLDAQTGSVIWSKHFPTDYQTETPYWGYSGHPLVFEDRVICLVGGEGSLVVAFEKDTGHEVWRALSAEIIGYSSPTLIECGGQPQVVVATPTAVVGLDPRTGAKLWDVPFRPHYAMAIATPQQAGDRLFVGGHGDAVVIKLDPSEQTATLEWRGKRNTALYPSNSTPLIVDDTVYGVDAGGSLRAVDLATGERLWEQTKPVSGQSDHPLPHGTAFLVRNHNHCFLFNERGELRIAQLSREGYQERDRAKLIEPTSGAFHRKVVWSYPAFAAKCIFVRNDSELACFSLAAK